MKVSQVRAWMAANKITQAMLAEELGYAFRESVAANISKDKKEVNPEFLGRLLTRFPELAQLLTRPDVPERTR